MDQSQAPPTERQEWPRPKPRMTLRTALLAVGAAASMAAYWGTVRPWTPFGKLNVLTYLAQLGAIGWASAMALRCSLDGLLAIWMPAMLPIVASVQAASWIVPLHGNVPASNRAALGVVLAGSSCPCS